ncbi:DUF4190 domain-containing protein [Streptomyces sp. NPDC001292]|uniref:DUF4190 domain-containing protein n=1 Tax=Streptomyces sp. NPDC001292 TaxID=3364558 RepID=UPI0036C9F2F2
MTSLVCLAPLGLMFGIVALVQISRSRQRGKGLAIAGLSVSGAVLLLAALVAATADFKVWTIPGRDGGAAVPVVLPLWAEAAEIPTGDGERTPPPSPDGRTSPAPRRRPPTLPDACAPTSWSGCRAWPLAG